MFTKGKFVRISRVNIYTDDRSRRKLIIFGIKGKWVNIKSNEGIE